jgi:hypothetical protein
VHCESSRSHYSQIAAKTSDNQQDGWFLTDKFTRQKHSVNWRNDGIYFDKFSHFEEAQREDVYFLAPRIFIGNKLASYGGNLSLTIRYDADSFGSSSSQIKKLDIRFSVIAFFLPEKSIID